MNKLSNIQKRVIFGVFVLFGLSAIINQEKPTEINTSSSVKLGTKEQKKTEFVEQVPTKILGTNIGFLIANSAGQTVHFGNGNGDGTELTCSVSWQLDDLNSQVNNAITIKSTKRSSQKTSINCYYKKEYFVESSKYKTGYSMSIIENNPVEKTATLAISSTLVSLPNDNKDNLIYLTIKASRVPITPEFYSDIF